MTPSPSLHTNGALFVVLCLLAAAPHVATAQPPFQEWSDCGSTGVTVWGVNIEPRPQVLGENWTVYYTWLPQQTFTWQDNITVTIDVTWDGIPMHVESFSLCNTTDPIALGDGYGACPYAAGVPSTIHDTNSVPSFVPTGPYISYVTYSTPSNPRLMCITFNQSYAPAPSKK